MSRQFGASIRVRVRVRVRVRLGQFGARGPYVCPYMGIQPHSRPIYGNLTMRYVDPGQGWGSDDGHSLVQSDHATCPYMVIGPCDMPIYGNWTM